MKINPGIVYADNELIHMKGCYAVPKRYLAQLSGNIGKCVALVHIVGREILKGVDVIYK